MGIQPIVSSCESLTESISQFIDFWLQPLMKALPSYLKDTLQLIVELSEIPQYSVSTMEHIFHVLAVKTTVFALYADF